ncbi:MAG TPA: hypothetical protein VEK74_05430 [Burkholderiaceae bacterium]|nr:hypothetical protein [Burkholderiaceae bacterium]
MDEGWQENCVSPAETNWVNAAMFKVVAVLTTLTGQQVGEYSVRAEPTATLMECQRKIATGEVTDQVARLERDANLMVDFSEPHVIGRAECKP